MIAVLRPGRMDDERRIRLAGELSAKLGVTSTAEFDKIYDAVAKSAACDASAVASVEYKPGHDPSLKSVE